MKQTIYFLALVLLAASCQKNEWTVQETQNDFADLIAVEDNLNIPTWGFLSYQSKLPEYLRAIGMNTPQISNGKATIGRVLFYDKNLSEDRTTSCASCHQPTRAFSDNVAFSTGVKGQKTHRNSPPLSNVANFAAHYKSATGPRPLLFWDDRASSVGEQSRQTFANPIEMGMEMPQVLERVKEQPYYAWLWKENYGDFNVTEEQVLECVSEFVGAMGSFNSKLDKSLAEAFDLFNETTTVSVDTAITQLYYGTGGMDTTITTTIIGLPFFSLSENRGRDIFIANCTKCHSPIRPLQEVFAACNGLDMQYEDQGLGALTGNPADNGVFKSPSLRNIALTAPYMHDGRFKTLEEVVNFYSNGVKNHPNLHPQMKRNGSTQLNLTNQQKQDLVAFLRTLTDNSFVESERFSNPFK